MLAGTTGSGKSVCLHSILLSLLTTRDPNDLRLLLIDPKQIELSSYQGLPHLLKPIITNSEDATIALTNVIKEMEQRENLLKNNNIKDWGDLKTETSPHIIIIVEELADLFAQAPNAQEPLIRLAQKARATGIHLILATQRPDAATFKGLLRTNIPSRIALTVLKASDSRIILDEDGAEKLLGKGDMLIKWLGEKTLRAHGLNISSSDIDGLLKN